MAAYPSTLPLPIRDGYALSPVSSVSRTSMDSGAARSRRRFTSTPTYVSLAWIFSEGEYAVFEAWFDHVADAGATWVDMPIANGLGVNVLSARFIGEPKPVMEGLAYRVSAQVEVRELPKLSAAELEVAETYLPDDITSGNALLHPIIHSTLPGYW